MPTLDSLATTPISHLASPEAHEMQPVFAPRAADGGPIVVAGPSVLNSRLLDDHYIPVHALDATVTDESGLLQDEVSSSPKGM